MSGLCVSVCVCVKVHWRTGAHLRMWHACALAFHCLHSWCRQKQQGIGTVPKGASAVQQGISTKHTPLEHSSHSCTYTWSCSHFSTAVIIICTPSPPLKLTYHHSPLPLSIMQPLCRGEAGELARVHMQDHDMHHSNRLVLSGWAGGMLSGYSTTHQTLPGFVARKAQISGNLLQWAVHLPARGAHHHA